MKTSTIQYIVTAIGLTLSVVSIFLINNKFNSIKSKPTEKIAVASKQERPNKDEEVLEEKTTEPTTTTSTTTTNATTTKKSTTKVTTTKPQTTTTQKVELPPIGIGEEVIYDGLTLTELTNKLNKNLSSTLEGTGSYFADYTKNTGLDPYLSLAIVLHETGCKWGCSTLVKECNNIGGIKGSPSCNGGSYQRYESLEAGITGYLDMVYNKYYSKGLTTPELMNPKYAASTSWAIAVNKYINAIKAS